MSVLKILLAGNPEEKSEKKAKKSLLISGIYLLVTMCILATTVFAWFAMNKQGEADGMSVSAQSTPNLVISDENVNIKTATFLNTSSSPFAVSFTPAQHALLPSTYDAAADDYNLKHLTDDGMGKISPKTGLANSGSTIGSSDFAAVTSSEASSYYIDYVVYIASHGVALTGHDLSVSFSGWVKGLEGTYVAINEGTMADTFKAMTIDFYIGDDLTARVGTLNLAQIGTTPYVILSDGTIPLNTSDTIKVTMRCYIDGALQVSGDSTKTYVRSESVDVSDVKLKVLFEASEH